MKIGIIVATHIPTIHHHKSLILRCIDSLNKQTRMADEVIFVINGFYEPKIDNLVDSIQKSYKGPFKIIAAARKCGCGPARNIGVSYLSEDIEYFGLLDVDDKYHEKKIELQEKRLIERPVDVLGTLHYDVDIHGNISDSSTSPGELATTEQISAALPTRNVVCGASTLIRKSMFLDVGNFEDKLIPGEYWPKYGKLMWEDWDYWQRVIKAGYKIENMDERLYYWCSGLSVSRSF